MCIVCIELASGRLRLLDAQRALTEMIHSTDDPELEEHYYEKYDSVIKDLMKEETDG